MIRPIGSMLDDFASQNSISFHEFRNQAISLASTMMNMGLRGEKIGIISENRYEKRLTET